MQYAVDHYPGEGDLVALVKTTSNVTSLSIPGLNGDVDGSYFLYGVIHVPASVAHTFTLRPNGLTTNLHGVEVKDISGFADVATWTLAAAVNRTGPVALRFRAWVSAQKTVGGVATWRYYESFAVAHHSDDAAQDQIIWRMSGNWQETATNLTSLDIVSSVASGILAGSQVRIYRGPRFDA